ncbi:MAG: hypothetical protein AAFV90_18870 [Cyanobacteria bacterium J06634_5]
MWNLKAPKIQKSLVNRSSSGQGKPEAKQLLDGEELLINAIEKVNWGEDALQFEICHCGIVGCQPGGWVSLRRVGTHIVVTPAFTKIAEASPGWETLEFSPPKYLLKKGALWINQETYTNTLCSVAPFPTFETVSELTGWEAAKLFQLEAPNRLLGKQNQSPTLPSDIILASSDGSFLQQVPELTRCLDRLTNSLHPVTLHPVTAQDSLITFYVDMAGLPEWQALSYNGSHYSLVLGPGYLIR